MRYSKDYSALIIPAAYDIRDIESVKATQWEVSNKDREIVAKESKKWNINSYFG